MKKGATWPKSFVVNRVIIRTDFSSGIPCSLENFQKDDTLLGRGAVVIRLEGENLSVFLTFSPKDPQDNHGTNVRASSKRSNGIVVFESAGAQREQGANWRRGFTGRIYIELYKSWPFLASVYEERKDFFGSVVQSAQKSISCAEPSSYASRKVLPPTRVLPSNKDNPTLRRDPVWSFSRTFVGMSRRFWPSRLSQLANIATGENAFSGKI